VCVLYSKVLFKVGLYEEHIDSVLTTVNAMGVDMPIVCRTYRGTSKQAAERLMLMEISYFSLLKDSVSV